MVKRLIALAGLSVLTVAIALSVICLLGVIPIDTFATAGQTGIRSLAGVAVTGCLLAAIGFWDE